MLRRATLRFFTKPRCGLCVEAKEQLEHFQSRVRYQRNAFFRSNPQHASPLTFEAGTTWGHFQAKSALFNANTFLHCENRPFL
jgi:hypothetical protein